jgi:regulator of protease activity HflC (stomatin/prohibitin superfamily)
VSALPFTATPILTAILYALLASAVILFVAKRALGKHGKSVPFKVMIGLPLAAVLAVVAAFSIMVVDVGHVEVVRVYGSVQERRYDPGVHLIVPGSRHDFMHVRRQIFELSTLDPDAPAAAGAAATLALSSDRISLAADITFPYQLNPDLGWKVFAVIGPGYEGLLLIPAARAAIREAAAAFTWTDATTSKRAELEQRIHDVFTRLVHDNLINSGFTKEEAEKAFVLMAPQIRRIAPPRALLAAVSERIAAEVHLERQGVLNAIAKAETERRGNEGIGVRKLVEELPKGMTANELRDLLYALADKQRADSMLKAVESNQAKVMIMGGNSPIAVAPPAP